MFIIYFADDIGDDESGPVIDETGELVFDDEVDVENEVQIRKMRYEKEKFLKEQQVIL